MGLADDIINKNKKKSLADQIISGEYQSNLVLSKPNSDNESISQIQSNIKTLQNQANNLNNQNYSSYKEWRKETRKNDNIGQKALSFLDDMFIGADKKYYNKKYGNNNEVAEINKKIREEQKKLDQAIINSEKSTTIEKLALPLASGLDNGVEGLKTIINKAGSLIPGQSMENYNSNPSFLAQKYQKVRSDTENPVLGIYQDLMYTTGNMIPAMTMPGKNLATLMTGATSFGNAYNQARQEGKTDKEATTYGLLSGSSEAFLEKALGGMSSLYGKSFLGKQLGKTTDKVLGRVIKSPTVRHLLSEAGSEFTEEYLQEVLEPVFRNLAFDENNEIKLVSEEALYSGFLGALNSSLVNGGNVITNKIGQKIDDMRNHTNISDEKNGIHSGTVNKIDSNTTNSLNSNENIPNSNVLPTTNINSLTQQNTSQNDLNEVKNDIDVNSIYQYEKSDNKKIDNLRKSASQNLNNSIESKNLINTFEKIIQDKNYNVLLDNTLTGEKGEFVNAQIKTLPNGETEIRINPNSNRAGEFLIMHEVTHAIETDEIKNLIVDYASKNQEFNESLEALKQTYGVNDVSSEVMADISGQLFGNQEFINSLSMEKPNIFKRIYNSIISLANKITGNSRESLFIKDLKNKWENAYRTQNNNVEDTKYMMIGRKGIDNAIKRDSSNQFLKNNLNNALDMNNQGKSSDLIRKETGWFQDKYGKWKFELSDENATILNFPQKNETYKLSEILSHEDLFELYPKLKKAKIRFTDLSKMMLNDNKIYQTNGNFNSLTNTITLGNHLLTSNEKLISTLLHEIQHRVQKYESFSGGTSIGKGIDNYKNNFGEIEARNTSSRRNLTYNERISNPPNSFTDKKSLIETKSNKQYNVTEVKVNDSKNQRTNTQENILQVHNNRSMLRGNKGQGLNSSFSLRNDKWQKHLEKNYKATGTRTKMSDIKIGQMTPRAVVETHKIKTAELKKTTSIKEINKQKIENNENAIKRLTQEKNALVERLQKKIKVKQELLNSKANKDTKLATQLNMQISNLNNQIQNRKLDFDRRIEYYKNKNEKMNSEEFKIQEQRIIKKQEYIDQAYEMTENMMDWKDKNKGIKYQINTMKRNLYDIMSKSEASKMYNIYFQPITENNAKSENFINSYNDRIKKLDLNNEESVAVQMLGEYKYNKKTLVTGLEVDEYISDHKLNYDKLSNAVEEFRTIYDELIVETNKILKEQGYKEIEYRKGYFPHFQEETAKGKFSKLAEKLGFSVNKNEQTLPTDIAGLTEIFQPGKTYFKNAQQRKGKITDYNALKGYDNYIRGAADIIFHTEDIQKLRALEHVIRTQYTDSSIQQKLEEIYNNESLDQEQKQNLVDLEYSKINNPLPNLVTELRNYTDSLANKKDIGDRGMEHMLGRETYTIMKNVQSRVSANMVGANISSALTNFIPITQAWGEVSTKNMAKAIKESISNQFHDDGFADCSTYLINRTKQADRLYRTSLDNINAKAGAIFESVDSITSNVIVRGKYYDNIDKGMSQEQAMRNANEFAKDIMAGRSKGDMPTIFNRKSPLIKLFTAFQLEVNNQYGYMLKDLPRNLGNETKKKLVGAFFKMFIGAWLYNKFSEAVTGRKSAFSPIDIVGESIQTVNNDNLSIYDKIKSVTTNMLQELSFVGGIMGGGRLPIEAAIPDIGTTVESFTQLTDDKKRNAAIKNLSKELSKPFFYIAMPFAGGQIKKFLEGASMYMHDLPGSYTSSGKLRFEAPKDAMGIAKSLIFGQYSSNNAKEYFDKGYMPLTEKQVQEIKKLGISVKEYRKYREELTKVSKIKSDKDSSGNVITGSSSGKKAYNIMNNNDLSNKAKNYLLSQLSTSDTNETIDTLSKLPKDEEIYKYYYSLTNDNRKQMIKDMKEYDLSAYQLYDYYETRKEYKETYTSTKAKEFIIDYLVSSNLTAKQKLYLYSKEYASDDTVKLLNQFKVNADNYLNTMKYISEIKFQYPGERYSTYRRQQIYQYINSLNASVMEKAILYKQAGYSISNYKNTMFDYIENLPLSKVEKNNLWKQLY